MSKRTLLLLLFAIPVLVVGGFYLRALVRHTFFQRAPKPEGEMQAQLRQQALQSESGVKKAVALYFPDFDTGALDQEARVMALAPNNEDRVRQIVLALIEGSEQGHARALPVSTALRAVFLTSGGDAYLDFSSDVTQDFPVGIASETLAIYSVVDSLTANIPAIKRVKILVQGQEVDTLDGHADLTGFYTSNLPQHVAAPLNP